MTTLDVQTRAFGAGDAELLLEGLERAARSAGGGPRRSRTELEWRYGAAPHGACLALVLAAGRPVAGIAATRHRVRFQGEDVHWLEVGDLFDDFAFGRGLARARGLLAAGKAFAEAFGGFAPERNPVMYGLPNRRAHRIGLARLEWEVLRSENELWLDLERAPAPAAGSGDLEVEELARFPEEVGAVFEAHASARAAMIVRDAAYLNWRHADAPGMRSTLMLARRAGIPSGLAVLRGGELVDWCVAPDDADTVACLLGAARARARAGGARELGAVFPDSAPEWMLFQRLGFRVRGTREYLCFRSFQRPAIMSWLYRNWSYTRGDTLR